MSEEELELLITMDDPVDGPDKDRFHHQARNTIDYWLGQPSEIVHRAEAANDDDASTNKGGMQ